MYIINLVILAIALTMSQAHATEPQVEMLFSNVAPCLDVTQTEPMPAMCTYFTLDGIRFSTAHSRDEAELLSIIYYPVGEEPQVITKERMKEIVDAKQMEDAI